MPIHWIWAGLWLLWPIGYRGGSTMWFLSWDHKKPRSFCLAHSWNLLNHHRSLTTLRPLCWKGHRKTLCEQSQPSFFFSHFSLGEMCKWRSCLGSRSPAPITQVIASYLSYLDWNSRAISAVLLLTTPHFKVLIATTWYSWGKKSTSLDPLREWRNGIQYPWDFICTRTLVNEWACRNVWKDIHQVVNLCYL